MYGKKKLSVSRTVTPKAKETHLHVIQPVFVLVFRARFCSAALSHVFPDFGTSFVVGEDDELKGRALTDDFRDTKEIRSHPERIW